MGRGTTLQGNTATAINRAIGSKYDKVIIVANDIVNVDKVANSIASVDAVGSIHAEIVSLVADKITLDSLYADKATLDGIYASKAAIDALAADQAAIDSVFADKIKLDSLYADKATLDSLFADKTTLDGLFADKAALDSLYADKAKLDSLYADKTTIDGVYAKLTELSAIAVDIAKGKGTNTATDSAILNALDNANIAITKAGEASTSAGNASTSEANALASLNEFKGQYYGSLTTAPTLDPLGNPITSGDMYFDSTLNEMRVYDGGVWKSAGSTVNGTSQRQSFTATAGQTTFTITGGYDAGFADVYLNGTKLQNGVDVDVTSGTDVVLTTGANAGDIVDVVAYGAFDIANTYTKAEVDNKDALKLDSSAYTATDVLAKVKTVDGVGSGLDADTVDGKHSNQLGAPVSTVLPFATSTVPTGFLECNGSVISRTTYSALFAVIGTTYGVGNGSTTFNIPDLRGEFIRGFDNGRGADIGRSIGTSQGDAIRNIVGVVKLSNPNQSGTGVFSSALTSGADANSWGASLSPSVTFDASTVVPTAADNRPRNIAMMYCIKY